MPLPLASAAAPNHGAARPTFAHIGERQMKLDEYLNQNRDLSFSEACDRYAEKTAQSGHDIDGQLARERADRNEHFRCIDGY